VQAHANPHRPLAIEDASVAMHLRIRVGAEQYALDLEHVLEVVELGEVTPVPGSGATLLGLRNLRGEILPALDLSAMLGVAGGSAQRSLVVVAEGDRRAGLAVDEAIDLSQLPEASAAVDSSLIRGGVLVEGALVGVVDVSAVLGSSAGSSPTGLT
jgi:purine-binding chemotaxis protein CheW